MVALRSAFRVYDTAGSKTAEDVHGASGVGHHQKMYLLQLHIKQ